MTPESTTTATATHRGLTPRAIPSAPAVQRASRTETFRAFFPDGAPTNNDSPLAAAWQWWHAVLAGRTHQAAALSANPADWGDFSAVANDLGRLALVNTVDHAPEMPDRVAYARLIPDITGQPVKVHSPMLVSDGRWITIIRRTDRWYVWGVSDVGYRPPCSRIYAHP